MTTTALTTRVLTAADLPAYGDVSARAFLNEPDDAVAGNIAVSTEPGRMFGVFDGDELAGGTNSFSRRMALPGGADAAVACVTHVVVAPGHRRRGVATALLRTQLRDLRDRGEPLAALWASEATIYGRFGYGPAGIRLGLDVEARAPFRPDVEVSPEPVRELTAEQARPRLAEIRPRAVAGRTGVLDRGPAGWDRVLFDPPALRKDGLSALRFAVHPDGYALYRVRAGWSDHRPAGVVDVVDLAADGLPAYAALWRHLLDTDLAGRVSGKFAADEPLPHLLADARAAHPWLAPGVWLRLVDVPTALAARRYAVPVDAVLAVRDAFCPWNDGGYRLLVDGTGAATVTATDAPADLALDVADLGACYLGGTRLAGLVDAGRVRVADPAVAHRMALAFLDAAAPGRTESF